MSLQKMTGGRVAALALAAALAACGGGDGGADDNSIRIGAIFDLTGPTADVGTDYADGVRAWVDWTVFGSPRTKSPSALRPSPTGSGTPTKRRTTSSWRPPIRTSSTLLSIGSSKTTRHRVRLEAPSSP